MDVVRYTGNGEWSALYVEGTLDRVGDHYLIDERIMQLFNVTEYHEDFFLRGGNDRDSVALTLDAIAEYENARTAAVNRARDIRAEAAALLAQAEELENGN